MIRQVSAKNLVFSLLIPLICLAACTTGRDKHAGPLVVKVKFLDQADAEMIGNKISSFRLVPIDYSPGNEISGISHINGYRDRIVFYSRKTETFWVVDPAGKILRRIKHLGKGPMEYLMPAMLTLSTDGNLVILDTYAKKLLEYSQEDEFIREVNVTGNYEILETLGADRIVCGSVRVLESESEPGYSLDICDRNLMVKSRHFPFYTTWLMGGAPPQISHFQDKLGISIMGDYHFYTIDSNDVVDTLFLFDFGDQGYDFSQADLMPFDEYVKILGQNMDKPITAGELFPQGDNYLIFNFRHGNYHIGFNAMNSTELTYRPIVEPNIIGWYKGFPIPVPRSMIGDELTGFFDAVDLVDIWDRHPDQRARAEQEPEFSGLLHNLDVDDNPILILFTLQNH